LNIITIISACAMYYKVYIQV